MVEKGGAGMQEWEKNAAVTAASVPRRLPIHWPAGARTAEQFVCSAPPEKKSQMREISGNE